MSQANRRAFLKGSGSILIGLPVAEFCLQFGYGDKLFAQNNVVTAPRLLTMSFTNGCENDFWNFEGALAPLADLRSKIILFNNVRDQVNDESMVDDHLIGGASLFTGGLLSGDQKGTGISIDQWLSRRVDKNTSLKEPLVAGVWQGKGGGQPRSPEWSRRSWMENGQPASPLVKPLEIFKKIFGDMSPMADRKSKLERQKSILDSVLAQMKTFTSDNSKLPASHKEFLLAHLERVRALEKRVTEYEINVMAHCQMPGMMPPVVEVSGDGNLPYSEFEKVYRLQMDLMVIALQCESTHTGSLMFGTSGEDYYNPAASMGWQEHWASHFVPDAHRAYRQYHASNLRYMLDKLAAAGILDQTTVVYGSEFGNGDHSQSPQPHLIAGGGGTLKMGQIIDAGKGRHTQNDIYATLLSALGHKVDKFGLDRCNVGPIREMIKT